MFDIRVRLVSAFPNYLVTIQMILTKLLGIFMTNLDTNFSFMLKWTFLMYFYFHFQKKTSYSV